MEVEPKIGEHFKVLDDEYVRIHPVVGLDLYNTLSRCIFALRLSDFRMVVMPPAEGVINVEKQEVIKCSCIKLVCDRCGCEMDRQTNVLLSDPPKYNYVCPKCGTNIVSTTLYPYFDNDQQDNDVSKGVDTSYYDGSLFVKEVRGLEPDDILNYYRNLYRAESSDTERGIIAWAINKILPTYTNQSDRIKSLKATVNEMEEDRANLIKENTELTNRLKSAEFKLANTQYYITESQCRKIVNEMLQNSSAAALNITEIWVKNVDDSPNVICDAINNVELSENGTVWLVTKHGTKYAWSNRDVDYFTSFLKAQKWKSRAFNIYVIYDEQYVLDNEKRYVVYDADLKETIADNDGSGYTSMEDALKACRILQTEVEV